MQYNVTLLNGISLKTPITSWECLVNYLPADSTGSFDALLYPVAARAWQRCLQLSIKILLQTIQERRQL